LEIICYCHVGLTLDKQKKGMHPNYQQKSNHHIDYGVPRCCHAHASYHDRFMKKYTPGGNIVTHKEQNRMDADKHVFFFKSYMNMGKGNTCHSQLKPSYYLPCNSKSSFLITAKNTSNKFDHSFPSPCLLGKPVLFRKQEFEKQIAPCVFHHNKKAGSNMLPTLDV